MIFVYWTIFNLIFNSYALGGPGQSSSIGVLPTAAFPTINDQNVPISGVEEVVTDCGWIYAAAGTTSPGYYSVPNFGTFNLGSGNIGQSNVGYNNTGYGNYGTGNIGRLNCGNGNIGYLNDGNGNMGALNAGNMNIGDGNDSTGSPCIGYNNTACTGVIGTFTSDTIYSIGLDLEGSYLIGNNSTGTGLIGQDNMGAFSIGFENENGFFSGNIGVQNNGDGLVGSNNDGTAVIGQYNEGSGIIGLYNNGSFQIGVNNTGAIEDPTFAELNIGMGNGGGYQDIGVLNTGTNLTGFNLTGSDDTGGAYIDTGNVPLSQSILFDPTDTVYTQNIGSNFNPTPSESRPDGVKTPFIVPITTEYRFNLAFPAILTVVDLGCPGDIIVVYDWSHVIMTTTIPQPAAVYNCTGLVDGDAALADPFYSRNFVTILPGLHILTFAVTAASPSSGTALAFRVDSILPRPPCMECEAPVPPIDSFGSQSIDLPDSFHLYVETEPCPVPGNSSVIPVPIVPGNSSAIPVHNSTSCTSSASVSTAACQDCEKSAIVWCKTKNFQMPRDLIATHAESKTLCPAGLGRPSTPAAQLEITSLLLQCRLKHQAAHNTTHDDFVQGPWIGSDWQGRDYNGEFCLVATGEFVHRAKDCGGKRRFICALP